MNKTIIIWLLAIAVIGGAWWLKSDSNGSVASQNSEKPLGGEVVTIHKSPTCGCCGVYAQYLEREGVATKVENMNDLSMIKEEYGIPVQLQSCHTSLVAGYVVEGHIPLSAVEKLLAEKPDIVGIALPGMPSGSPGMPGPQTEPWVISAIQKDGSITEFMTL